MSKPRTILLIPEDPKLLALGPCGYRPPMASLMHLAGLGAKPCPVCGEPCRWSEAPTEQTDSRFVCASNWRHSFRQADVEQHRWQAGPYAGEYGRAPRALVLAHDGKVLPPGCLAAVPYGGLGAAADVMDAVRDCLRGYTVVWPAGMEGEIVLLDADGQVMT